MGYWRACILSETYVVLRVDIEEVRRPRDFCSPRRQWGKGGSLPVLHVYTGEPSGIGAWAQGAGNGNKAPSA